MFDPIEYLFNDHHWYMLHDGWDHVRAWIWVLTNIITGVSYFLIPMELQVWRYSMPTAYMRVLAGLFSAFIGLCGTSHFVMVVVMPTAPWWAIWFPFMPMAVVSLMTWLVLRVMRRDIRSLLEAVFKVYG